MSIQVHHCGAWLILLNRSFCSFPSWILVYLQTVACFYGQKVIKLQLHKPWTQPLGLTEMNCLGSHLLFQKSHFVVIGQLLRAYQKCYAPYYDWSSAPEAGWNTKNTAVAGCYSNHGVIQALLCCHFLFEIQMFVQYEMFYIVNTVSISASAHFK